MLPENIHIRGRKRERERRESKVKRRTKNEKKDAAGGEQRKEIKYSGESEKGQRRLETENGFGSLTEVRGHSAVLYWMGQISLFTFVL